MSFDACLAFTLEAEGGFVNDPRDPGGATNMGVTLATLRTWKDQPGLSVAAVHALTVADVEPIYGADYWNRLRCDALPAGCDLMVFDFAVTSGTLRSAKMLQVQLGCDADGSIGPDTLARAGATNVEALVDALAGRQAAFYRTLAAFPTFGKGWLARTERRRVAAHAMSQAHSA